MLRIGLTGNVGCGKSSVARMLAEMGAVVCDADRLVHALLAPGGDAVEEVLAAFPGAAAPDGEVDRRALARTVFADPAARRRLEAMVHPRVIAWSERLADEAEAAGAAMFVHEASLLFEAWRAGGQDPRERFDAVIVVTCDPAVQLERLVARSGLADREAALADARSRMAAQMPQDEKARLADVVIDNSGDLAETERRVRVACSALLGRAPRE